MEKLVRDRIPEIMKSRGQNPKTRIADKKECDKLLINKLQEEIDEFVLGKEPKELADILEVVYAIAAENGIKKEDLESMRKKKAQERGGFSRKIVLID